MPNDMPDMEGNGTDRTRCSGIGSGGGDGVVVCSVVWWWGGGGTPQASLGGPFAGQQLPDLVGARMQQRGGCLDLRVAVKLEHAQHQV